MMGWGGERPYCPCCSQAPAKLVNDFKARGNVLFFPALTAVMQAQLFTGTRAKVVCLTLAVFQCNISVGLPMSRK